MVRALGEPTATQRRHLQAAARKKKRADAELISAVRTAHAEGVSVRQLALTVERSTNTIQRWLKD